MTREEYDQFIKAISALLTPKFIKLSNKSMREKWSDEHFKSEKAKLAKQILHNKTVREAIHLGNLALEERNKLIESYQ